MKTKSLFISTVAMVVMLIVALSVGTFAWYTAQDSVNATGATVGAVETDAAAIAIGYTNDVGTDSTLLLGAGEVRPMIPVTKPADGALPAFNEALLQNDKINTVNSESPWREPGIFEEPPDGDGLYLKNLDTVNTVTVTPSVTINANTDDDLNSLLRVSLYVKDGTSNVYLGTWGNGTAYAAELNTEEYLENAPSTVTVAENSFPLTASGAAGTTFDIGPGATRQIHIQAWLEGTLLDTTNMTKDAAGFNVKFQADQAEEEVVEP